MTGDKNQINNFSQGLPWLIDILIQEVIGVGGMGSVYRARDLHFPNAVKLVAVKEMINSAPDPLIRQTIVMNFEREANILVTLNHPAIPRIYDYFTFDERSYLVLEFIGGKDLEAILADSDTFIPEEQVIGWAIELCDVLQYLHTHREEPVVFRDMKPSNIMINQSGHVILVDFGIAKVFRSGQKGTMIGTEGYSPPEQYRGEASTLADIYALGATLHHVLTRRDPRLEPPFTFSDRPIKKFNPNVSLELDTIIMRALEYDPTERFQTAEEMKAALVSTAHKTGALTRIAFPTVTLASLPEAIKPLWKFECEDEIRGSPSVENGVVYVGAYDNNLYALNSTSGSFLWKYASDGGIATKPAVQENIVYFGSEDHRVHAVSTRGGKVIWTYYTDGPVRSSPRLAEGHLFVGSDDGFLHAVNLISSRRAWRVEAGEPVRSSPCITNDFVYFGSEGGEFIAANFRGEVKWRFKAKRGITSSPLVSQGVIYFTSLDTSAFALDTKAGWVLWRYRMEKGSISSPAKVDNFLMFGSADGNIYCLDAGSARELWKYPTGHQVSGSPIVYKDAVYCGSVDGFIYCLEYRTGRLRWKYQTGGPITGTPEVKNDVLYIGSTDHAIYAFVA